ncbi:hypothetical protein V7S43_007089 [Phytophthora oleae]|uniref:SH3 domain-containing protein n=1 Tax=Phytophthora oleae TaxID=2107226 RepID=A0ABD3FRA6_9STRA
MRWYCVHPSLPLQAELRIRVAPDCNAAERARIPQGRAIATCSPVFQVPNDDVDADPISWLQVAYQDAVSGETDGGFVMATLPDGTALVVPWEMTNYSGCCEVTDSAALLLDGPHLGSQSVGTVQNIKFLYCTVEESEKRVQIFHPDLESVWIDKKDLRIVCTRLKHQQCKIPHAFFELNVALPEEAQIAIREFPSKNAQTIGLLSRGETLEVVIRGGNWLQIAGGNVDKAWVMWRTDALELLQEASDVRSNACEEIEENVGDPVGNSNVSNTTGEYDEAAVTNAELGGSGENPVPELKMLSLDGQSIQSTTMGADAILKGSVEHGCSPANLVSTAGPCGTEGNSFYPSVQLCGDQLACSIADGDVHRALAHDAYVDGPTDRNGNEDKDDKPMCVTQSWEDQSIQSMPVVPRGEDGNENDPAGVHHIPISTAHIADWDLKARPAESIHNTTEECFEAVAVIASPDERPIHPASSEVEEDTDASVRVADNIVAAMAVEEGVDVDASSGLEAVAVIASPDERPIHPASSEVEEDTDASVRVADNIVAAMAVEEGVDVDASSGLEAVAVIASPDERPIHPASSEVEEDTDASVRVADNIVAAMAVEEGVDVDASSGLEAVAVIASPDERPIHPASSEVEEDTDASVRVADNIVAAMAVEEGVDVDASSGLEAVAVIASPDERPIHPASSEVEEDTDASVRVADNIVAAMAVEEGVDVDASSGLEAVAVIASPDERPIHPASSEVEEDTDASVRVADNIVAAMAVEEGVDVDASSGLEAVAVIASPDERPIHPASSEVEEDTDASVRVADNIVAAMAVEEGVDVDASSGLEAVAVIASPDERPIHPASSEVEEDTDASVRVADNIVAAMAVEEGVDVDASSGLEAVAVIASPDERPIHPASSEVEEDTDASVRVADNIVAAMAVEEGVDVDASSGLEAVAVIASPDERPIHPASSEVEEDTDASVRVADNIVAAMAVEEGVDVDASSGLEAVAVIASPDERPIHPASSEVEEDTDASVRVADNIVAAMAVEEGVDVDASSGLEAVAVIASPDERPIHPASSEVEEDTDVLVKVVTSSGVDFVARGEVEEFAAKSAAGLEMYDTVGCVEGNPESASESDSGDIAVLGNLDDVFYPVDEIIVGIAGEEDMENAVHVCDYNDSLSQEKEQSAFDADACGGNNVTSFTLATQVKSNVEETDNSVSASFLQEFGVVKYCERKKALYPANDRLSHAMFNADQDDADLLFEVFVGDDPLSDEWFHDVASKSFVPTLRFASRPTTSMLNLSIKTTYALIMGGAAAEAILESELLDDDGNYDLVCSFRYPLPIRSRPSPLRSPLRQRQSASADSSPEAPQATIAHTQLAVPPAGVSTTSRLDQRKLIGEPKSIAKPPSTLVRPRSFIHTPASASTKPTVSRVARAPPALSETSPSKPSESLLQRKGAISKPNLPKIPTSAISISKSVESSGLPMPRTSFGFRRPSSFRKK